MARSLKTLITRKMQMEIWSDVHSTHVDATGKFGREVHGDVLVGIDDGCTEGDGQTWTTLETDDVHASQWLEIDQSLSADA